MNDILLKFNDFMKKKELSSNTLDAYTRDVEGFLIFLRALNISYIDATNEEINAYSQFLKGEGKANSSIGRCLISIRAFYKFLLKENKLENIPMNNVEAPKHTRPIPLTLTIKEVEKLLNMPDTFSVKGKRDKAMLEVMYATGMKVSEILNISVYNINLKEKYILCDVKNKENRIIPIGSYAIECLEEYLKERHNLNNKNSQLLFLNNKGDQMTRQGFWKLLRAYSKEAGIDKPINTSTLRHSFAVHLLQNGADMVVVQRLLGHKSISATQVYSEIYENNKITEEYLKAHPRA